MSDLRGFLDHLENEGELIRINEKLSPSKEISAALKRFDGGKAIIFENVDGYDVKVVGGIRGTPRRILDALNVKNEDLYQTLLDAMRKPTKCKIGDGPVNEIIEEGDLSKIPILTHFDGDPGPYITSGILYARSPDGKIENVSFHRLLVLNKKRLTIRIVPRHLYRLTQLAKQAGNTSLDVTVSIGLHPATLLSAALPAAWGVSEFDIANTLLGGKLRLTKC